PPPPPHGAGWTLVQRLGHAVTPTHPALVPLVLDDAFFHAQVSGVSQDVTLRTFAAGRQIDRRQGALLWTHFGVSGPVVMDASRFWVIARAGGDQPELRCAMIPESFDVVEKWLLNAADASPRRSLAMLLADRAPRRIAEVLAALSGNPALGRMTREQRRQVVHALTDLALPVMRDRGWNYAEVTAGGVPMAEVDHRTMTSRVAPHLHLVGEMLDVDGRIGGFNFQWAWATGHAAGRAAGAMIRR
ncbi:MAG: aminoacetone oxidase family FAD-binding enzyme, partial [Phycisphaeraceae bacterium]